MEKLKYISPLMEIHNVEFEDVICCSDTLGGNPGPTTIISTESSQSDYKNEFGQSFHE